ncbi:phage holin family protein (plasmid) [Pseudalkalibacillus hwajinpoensis]|uniref:phage holin family protein n=1 Tax=Guptibacillus hwajinpoensis TaxID=208199 RepID=UPI00325B94D5
MGTVCLGGYISYLFGSMTPLLNMLVLFVIVDYISGMLASAYEGKLSSAFGFIGIFKKIVIFSIIAIAHSLDQLFGGHMIRDATLFFYLSNELLSIIENAGRLNVPIPGVIKNAVKILKGKADKK